MYLLYRGYIVAQYTNPFNIPYTYSSPIPVPFSINCNSSDNSGSVRGMSSSGEGTRLSIKVRIVEKYSNYKYNNQIEEITLSYCYLDNVS